MTTLQKFLKNRLSAIKQPAIKLFFQNVSLLPGMVLLLHLSAYGQIDQRKLDSLSRLIDSSAQAYKVQQDSAIKQRDSAYKSEVNEALQQNSRDLDNFLAEQKRKEAKERQQARLRIIIGIALLVMVTIIWFRRKKLKT